MEKLAEATVSVPRKDDSMREYCRDCTLKRCSLEVFYRKILEIQEKAI